MSYLQTPLGRFRVISAIEGLSYVLLVFIAMPLKYGLDLPQMVKVLGMAHGVLFMAFVLALVLVLDVLVLLRVLGRVQLNRFSRVMLILL